MMKVSYPSHSPTQPENKAILVMKASYPSHSPTWPGNEVKLRTRATLPRGLGTRLYQEYTTTSFILQRPYVILCSWLCLCNKGTVNNKVDTRDKSSVCFAHLNPSQVCRRGWYCDMEVSWQLKDAVTKQFMPSFIIFGEHFLYKPYNVVHTMWLYICCKKKWLVINKCLECECYRLYSGFPAS